MSNKNKNKSGIVYSTATDFEYETDSDSFIETVQPKHQNLRVMLDRKNRGGKQVTLITGFKGSEGDLEKLTRTLKNICGTGGSCKNGEIIIQGDQRNKITGYLKTEGFKYKLAGG